MTIDEAIALVKIERECVIRADVCDRKCEKCDLLQDSTELTDMYEQLAEWLEKLKTIESIMLIYNANWYADEDNGVPDSEVLESIWNVIQDNGLDIDIEQDYRKGKSEGYNKAIDDFIKAVDKHCVYYAGECRNLTRDDIICIANNMKLRSDG